MNRRMANLVRPTHRTTISYAKYLMCVHLGRILNKYETVDHINEDKMDDRIDNYQILSSVENKRKSQKLRTYKDYICPVCETKFKRRLGGVNPTVKIPSCSRSCSVKFQWLCSTMV